MAKFFTKLSAAHRQFIARQKIFFVASAPAQGRVNLSPKGMDTFRVFSATRVGYLDFTGSGNETAAHLVENGRLTFMLCSFEKSPLIFRIYGRGRAVHPRDSEWKKLRAHFGPPLPGERQLIVADIESIQTSCGFAVPYFAYQGERNTPIEYSTKIGPAAIAACHAGKNARSIDGLPTS